MILFYMRNKEIKLWEENLELIDGLEIKSEKIARMIIKGYLELVRSDAIKDWVSKEGRDAIEWRMEKIRKYREYLKRKLL